MGSFRDHRRGERGVRALEWPALSSEHLVGLDSETAGGMDGNFHRLRVVLYFIKRGGNDSPKWIRCSRALMGHFSCVHWDLHFKDP